ncbi:hypothetical protein [Haliangium sp.]|uniref:hypothetical protein n=1 Tax=Haliangium sp. TaxID=2663208 RepID=UPI003D141BD9
MDENPKNVVAYLAPGWVSSAEVMSFPGASESSGRPPGRTDARFDPDDNLATPEAHEEVVRGQRIQLSPAKPAHGDTHMSLDGAVYLSVAKGYIASTDLLTRRSEDTDFATDACIRKAGTDPATGTRYLEELSFEVFNSQSRRYATERARDVIASGVRRLFGLFARARSPKDEDNGEVEVSVEEWISDTETWRPYRPNEYIRDPCLDSPLPVAALVGALDFGDTALRGLLIQKHPRLEQIKRVNRAKGLRDGRAEGLRDGVRRSVFTVLGHRGLALDPAQRSRIDACDDLEQLERWNLRAITAERAADLFD